MLESILPVYVILQSFEEVMLTCPMIITKNLLRINLRKGSCNREEIRFLMFKEDCILSELHKISYNAVRGWIKKIDERLPTATEKKKRCLIAIDETAKNK